MRRCPRVHQKTILADGKLLYIGSANLTGAGVGAKSENRRNFEVGIITDEPAMIDRADSLFELIWCGDMCLKCGRKSVCPCPLESPAGR
jgi:phosphatidylserine/phosphatidylglycerophosphate/cardiolipin synthase-like enzyme